MMEKSGCCKANVTANPMTPSETKSPSQRSVTTARTPKTATARDVRRTAVTNSHGVFCLSTIRRPHDDLVTAEDGEQDRGCEEEGDGDASEGASFNGEGVGGETPDCGR